MIQIWTEGCSAPLQVPFTVLQGEGVEFLGRAADALIAISNYRLHIKFKDSVINVSVCLVLPQPSQNPCEVQCGIAPMLYLIRSPRSRGSLFLTNFLFSCLVLPAVGLLSQLFSLPLFSLSLILLLAFLRGIVGSLPTRQLYVLGQVIHLRLNFLLNNMRWKDLPCRVLVIMNWGHICKGPSTINRHLIGTQ